MRAVIEMSKGSTDKTEVDKATGQLVLDRKLNVAVPANYGFVEKTLAADGDPLDIFVLGDPIQPLSQVAARPIGIFLCYDQGVQDHKILAVPSDMSEREIQDGIAEITRYLSTYKQGFSVVAYSNSLLHVLSVYKKSKVRVVRKDPTLGWQGLTARAAALIGLFAWIYWFVNYWSKK